MDQECIKNAIKGANVVVICTGPYYKFEKIILPTVIEAGINYVDVCDDTGATYDTLELNALAKKVGVIALIGMGSSPGVINLLAVYAANELLEVIESIEMFHIHGGELNEGVGVIGHRFYCLSNDIPMILDVKATLITILDQGTIFGTHHDGLGYFLEDLGYLETNIYSKHEADGSLTVTKTAYGLDKDVRCLVLMLKRIVPLHKADGEIYIYYKSGGWAEAGFPIRNISKIAPLLSRPKHGSLMTALGFTGVDRLNLNDPTQIPLFESVLRDLTIHPEKY